MICIRIFNSGKEAGWARRVLQDGGFKTEIKEDRFGKITLDRLGMKPRFRLLIQEEDFDKITLYLAKNLATNIS